MLFKRIFTDIQVQTAVNIFEEYLAQVVSFRDDNCILFLQVAQIGKCRAEHRVG